MGKKITLFTACSIVIANMIGTGVFTSLGFQLDTVTNSWSIILLWVFGGVMALLGAFAYAELGTAFKESGGDYIFLSRLIHPALGYLSAWAGLIVGFSAPVALAAIAFVKYMEPLGLGNSRWIAILLIVLVGLTHCFSLKSSSRFQNLFTIVKIAFIVVLIVIGLGTSNTGTNSLLWNNSWKKEIFTSGFAVSMIYVSFAYTGWNAAAYVSEEIANPRKNIPKSLILSTVAVAVLYILFQMALLHIAPLEIMKGKEEVTYLAFAHFFGSTIGKWISAFVAFQLVATISSYLWVGPRLTHALAREYRLWQPFAKCNKEGIPVRAIILHIGVSVLLTLSGSFEKVLLYAGFVLQCMSILTIISSLCLKQSKEGFQNPLRPWGQILFIIFNIAVLIFTFVDRPKESAIGIGMLGIGLILYAFDRKIKPIENTSY